tara:strand:- start:2289 stop:2654 length:366 start_codon:yes stop_codon:yes gene_type:complete
MFVLFLLFNMIYSIVIPTCGNIYKKTLYIPLVGVQNIETEFSNNNLIYIRLSGLVVENGTAKYKVVDDNINLLLSENLVNLLKKRRSEFKLTNYDTDEDKLYIKIHVRPLFLKKNIALERE